MGSLTLSSRVVGGGPSLGPWRSARGGIRPRARVQGVRARTGRDAAPTREPAARSRSTSSAATAPRADPTQASRNTRPRPGRRDHLLWRGLLLAPCLRAAREQQQQRGAEQEPRRRSHSLTTPLGDVEEYFEPATPSKRGDRVVEWYKLEHVSQKRRDIVS